MNARRMGASIGLVVLCVLLGVVLSGCISGRSDVSYGPKGPAVGAETLRQIKVGCTSKEWVLGTLGTPSSETATPEGTEILKYVYTKKVDSNLDAFLFLDFDDKREERTTYYFEVTNGTVTKFWKE
ncbi:MAG: outer membrane protein assembly factor BamE [bacterium]|nr:outer membrane protein assembly factor BamE [bacterium]